MKRKYTLVGRYKGVRVYVSPVKSPGMVTTWLKITTPEGSRLLGPQKLSGKTKKEWEKRLGYMVRHAHYLYTRDSEEDLNRAFYGSDENLDDPAEEQMNRDFYENPPMYAHNLYEKKTHGLNLKQMRRLYAMVSRGNQKAITYARNVLGIPFSESPSQVKAVVLHHVRDLAERRGLKRNAPWSKVRNAFAKAGFQFHAYGKVDDPATGKKLYDYYKGDSLTDGQKKIIQSLIPEVEFGRSQSQYAPEIRRPVVIFPVKRRLRRNPASSDVTPVVFRTFRSGGDVIALFPYELGTMDSRTMMSYEHIGQHGSADMGLTSVLTRPSTPDEIRPLKNELERIGYELKILKRIPGDAVRVRAEKLRSIK